MKLRQVELLSWYHDNRRPLPWRSTSDPYAVLVSEVMLQQTQAARVVDYWLRFMQAFPTVEALASAGDDALHRLWKGLGYPSRADRLRETARAIVVAGGVWPRDAAGLEELPGIGPYTARAVAAFAFGQAVAVLDTNVARVLARRDGLRLPLPRDALQAAAQAALAGDDPRTWNNAVMELGATVCTARAPACERCPWAAGCASRDDAAVHAATATPLKVAIAKQTYGVALPRGLPRIHVVLGLIHHDGRYLVTRRKPDAHQGDRWELPGGKREPGEDERVALARELREELGVEVLAARHLMRFHHAYPDRAITFSVYRVRLFDPLAAKPLAATALRWVPPAELVTLAMPDANHAIQARMRSYHRLG